MSLKRKHQGDLYIEFVFDDDKNSNRFDYRNFTLKHLGNILSGQIDIVYEDLKSVKRYDIYDNKERIFQLTLYDSRILAPGTLGDSESVEKVIEETFEELDLVENVIGISLD